MHTTFLNCRLCIGGELEYRRLVVSSDPGLAVILPETGFIGGEAIDLEDGIIAPGFLLLPSGPLAEHLAGAEQLAASIQQRAQILVSRGVTAFWDDLPSGGGKEVYESIAFSATRKSNSESQSTLLGFRIDAASSRRQDDVSLEESSYSNQSLLSAYGACEPLIRLVSVSRPDAATVISSSSSRGVKYILDDTVDTTKLSYEQSLAGLKVGASCIGPLTSAVDMSAPGLLGLAALNGQDAPYIQLMANYGFASNTHPAIFRLLYRAAPSRCLLVHGSAPEEQRNMDNNQPAAKDQDGEPRNTLQNMMAWTGCDVAQAVYCFTENVADFLGITDRGRLKRGCVSDFVVLNDDGDILQTWISGVKVWDRDREL